MAALCACLLMGWIADAAVSEPSPRMVPIDWAHFAVPTTPDKELEECTAVLLNCVHYNLRWLEETFEEDAAGNMYVLTRMEEHGIRPGTSVSYAMAAVLKTGVFDEERAGASREEALGRTLKLMRGIAAAHKVNGNPTQGWGDTWQSALWAAQLAFGGWMLWDELEPALREMLIRLAQHEADRFLDYEVPYWNHKDGDTKAEENSWNSMILNVAVAMMPEDPHVRLWKEKCSELMVSAYATKRDWKENGEVRDGRPVRDWLKGYNATDGGLVVNHGIMHPDYMVSETMSLWAHLTQSLAGKPIPETADFNGAMIYRTLATRIWTSPPYEKPGGTVYVPGKAHVYYPMGVDWSTCDVSPYYLIDAWAHVLHWDQGLAAPAADWMRLRAAKMLEMQQRHEDDRMFAKGEYDTYEGAEQWVAWCIADAFLALWLDARGALSEEANWLATNTQEPGEESGP